MDSTPKVFLSHTTRDPRDHALANHLAGGLRELGAGVWIAPENVPSGAEWQREIVAAIVNQCTHFLVIVSAASVKAPWVLEEIRLAYERWGRDKGLRILPLVVGATEAYPGNDFLEQFQRVPYRAGFQDQLGAVAEALAGFLQLPDRKKFDGDVAELFSLFGYEVRPDGPSAAETTVLQATSPRRNRPSLHIECRFQDRPCKYVDRAAVQHLAATVTTARMNGAVDQAYLVTNTGFTQSARDCLAGQPQQRYVFLVTYEELLQSLLDAHNYLQDFIASYEEQKRVERFVELRAIDMCGFPVTAFDALPGDQFGPSSMSWTDFKTDGLIGVVLEDTEFERLIKEGFAFRQEESGIVSMDRDRLGAVAEEWKAREAADSAYAILAAEFLDMSSPLSVEEIGRAYATAPAESLRTLFGKVRHAVHTCYFRRVTEKSIEKIIFHEIKIINLYLKFNYGINFGRVTPKVVSLYKRGRAATLDKEVATLNKMVWSSWNAVVSRRLAEEEVRLQSALQMDSEAAWQAVMNPGTNPPGGPPVWNACTQRWRAAELRELSKVRIEFRSSLSAILRGFPLVLDTLVADSGDSSFCIKGGVTAAKLGRSLDKLFEKTWDDIIALYKRKCGATGSRALKELVSETWRVLTEQGFADAANRNAHYQERRYNAATALVQRLPGETLSLLGSQSAEGFAMSLPIDPTKTIRRIMAGRRLRQKDPSVSGRREIRWARDLQRAFLREYVKPASEESGSMSASEVTRDPVGPYGSILLNLIELEPHDEHREVRLLRETSSLRLLHNYVDSPHGNLLVMFGDYGAGKTTVTNRLMYDLARRKLDRAYDTSVRLPLLVNLREYNKVPDFTQLLRSFLTDQAEMGDINMRLFKRLNDAGRFVLLLDGFDEMLARVTKPDRRRCFLEIAEYIGPKSKVVLTGRPGYFPDHAEFAEVLDAMNRKSGTARGSCGIAVRTSCLQLMNDQELDEFVGMNREDAVAVYALFRQQPGLRDLARRPVLAGMVAESAAQLAKLSEQHISVRRLYELYTDRWVTLEEDKGSFRILLDPDKKSTFLRYLAMQMHLANTLSIHYRQLDRRIADHFGLESSDTIDHFSHDVRTCSFLSRTDGGEYRFIHKSFMEYFVTCEYERLSESPYAEAFDKPLSPEMQSFVDAERLPPELSLAIVLIKSKILDIYKSKLSELVEEAVANQEFERAAAVRDVRDTLVKKWPKALDAFATMRREKLDAMCSTTSIALRSALPMIAIDGTTKDRIMAELERTSPALLTRVMEELTKPGKTRTQL